MNRHEAKEYIPDGSMQWWKLGPNAQAKIYEMTGLPTYSVVPEDVLILSLYQSDVSTIIKLMKGEILSATYEKRNQTFTVFQFNSKTGEKEVVPSIPNLVEDHYDYGPSGIVFLRHQLVPPGKYINARNELLVLVNPVLQDSGRFPQLPSYPSQPKITS